jgi:Cellulase (glycosyl hydrolase family 5)/Divergent InlB B-repeat domain/Carboxypeptidase regulatory-like domain/Immunoglobulin domain
LSWRFKERTKEFFMKSRRLFHTGIFLVFVLTVTLLLACIKKSMEPDIYDNFLTGTVSGKIVDKTGRALSGVEVVTQDGRYSAISTQQGQFTISGIKDTGALRIEIMRQGFLDTSLAGIHLGRGQTVEVDSVSMISSFVNLSGMVRRADGQPPQAMVGVAIANQTVSCLDPVGTGVFSLVNALPGTLIIVAAGSMGWGQDTVVAVAGQAINNLFIVLNKSGGTVQGTVTTSAGGASTVSHGASKRSTGSPVAGAYVTAFNGSLSGITDTSGRYTLNHVPSVPIVLTVMYNNTVIATLSGVAVAESSTVTVPIMVNATQVIGKHSNLTLYSGTQITSSDSCIVNALAVAGSNETDSVAFYLWDANNDNVFDTVTSSNRLTVHLQEPDSVALINYSVITLGNDTVGAATILIHKTKLLPTAPIYFFVATVSDTTIGKVSPTSGNYAAGALIKLTRTSDSGYVFDHWGGADSGSMHGDTLNMPGHNVAVKAVFKAKVAPGITTQPQSQTVTAGQSVTFSVTTTGTAPLSYQWSIGGTAISGATSASYSISNAQAANAGTYTVTVSNGILPNATSNGAVLTVSPALTEDSIYWAPPLDVEGTKIVNANGHTVQLKGFATMEPTLVTRDQIVHFRNDWNITVLRLPLLTSDCSCPYAICWTVGNIAVNASNAAYLAAADSVVKWCRDNHIYVLLDGWHEGGQGNTVGNFSSTLAAWGILADRYKNQDHILWEIFDEPHNVTWATWVPMAQQLIDTIRARNPVVKAIVAGTVNWCQQTGVPTLEFNRDRVIYSWHPYSSVYGSADSATWEKNFGFIMTSGVAPVMNTEWGFTSQQDSSAYGTQLIQYMKDKGMSWTGWCYSQSWGPAMLKSENPEVRNPSGNLMYKAYHDN